eukprot:m.272646 g.272646  ORF g.272646 m.272646 type:complete len:64 (-) comp58985_c0_seq1:199-390(-)
MMKMMIDGAGEENLGGGGGEGGEQLASEGKGGSLALLMKIQPLMATFVCGLSQQAKKKTRLLW